MSYGITLNINTGIEDHRVIDCGNYTYNVSDMYALAMGFTLTHFDGMKCSEALPLLQKGVKAMQDNPTEYKKLNPENGWGDYEGALHYLQNLANECSQNPLCIIDVH